MSLSIDWIWSFAKNRCGATKLHMHWNDWTGTDECSSSVVTPYVFNVRGCKGFPSTVFSQVSRLSILLICLKYCVFTSFPSFSISFHWKAMYFHKFPKFWLSFHSMRVGSLPLIYLKLRKLVKTRCFAKFDLQTTVFSQVSQLFE